MADTIRLDGTPTEDEANLWIRRAAEGDDRAFASLATGYTAVIRSMIAPLGVSEEDKSDLYQEGLIGLYKAVLLYNPDLSSFSTFARVCIRSAVLGALRKTRKESVPRAENLADGEIRDEAPSPEQILMGKEALSDLLTKLDRLLSPMERRVLGLHLQGMKQKEIASRLGKDTKSVENTLFRLRRKLSELS